EAAGADHHVRDFAVAAEDDVLDAADLVVIFVVYRLAHHVALDAFAVDLLGRGRTGPCGIGHAGGGCAHAVGAASRGSGRAGAGTRRPGRSARLAGHIAAGASGSLAPHGVAAAAVGAAAGRGGAGGAGGART